MPERKRGPRQCASRAPLRDHRKHGRARAGRLYCGRRSCVRATHRDSSERAPAACLCSGCVCRYGGSGLFRSSQTAFHCPVGTGLRQSASGSICLGARPAVRAMWGERERCCVRDRGAGEALRALRNPSGKPMRERQTCGQPRQHALFRFFPRQARGGNSG